MITIFFCNEIKKDDEEKNVVTNILKLNLNEKQVIIRQSCLF